MGLLRLLCLPVESATEDRLNVCAERLSMEVAELSAPTLLAVCEAMAALLAERPAPQDLVAWRPPRKLLRRLVAEFDEKRHDLAAGTLWRAACALESSGAKPGSLTLDAGDVPPSGAVASALGATMVAAGFVTLVARCFATANSV